MPLQKPLHVGIAGDLQARVESGEWKPGARIPSIRDLATELGVSPFTVASAVRQLKSGGKLETIHGKGTYVARVEPSLSPPVVADLSWQNALLRQPISTRANAVVQPFIHQAALPADTVMLAGGGEAIDVLATKSLVSAWRGLLNHLSSDLLEGWSPVGEVRTREWMAGYLAKAGINAKPEQMIVTSGGQQALSLVAQALLGPDDTVLVERPMYPFALSIFDLLGVRCIDVPVDEQGRWVLVAEDLIERFRPKLVLTVPTGQVPTGATMPLEQRRVLLQAARRHGIMILEDDHGSEISYDRPPPPAIKSLDTHGHVIYAKSFSKITLRALRIGCLVADGLVLDALRNAKLISDRYTSTILQEAFLAYVTRPSFSRDLTRYRKTFRERRDAMLAALQQEMPDGVTWTTPASGAYLWLTVPPGVSAREVALRGRANGVVVANSSPFFAQGDPDTGFRLTFTDNEVDRLTLGVQRLAAAVKDAMRDREQGGSLQSLAAMAYG
jgi:DNA-binding transcriptional MocR family regulator